MAPLQMMLAVTIASAAVRPRAAAGTKKTPERMIWISSVYLIMGSKLAIIDPAMATDSDCSARAGRPVLRSTRSKIAARWASNLMGETYAVGFIIVVRNTAALVLRFWETRLSGATENKPRCAGFVERSGSEKPSWASTAMVSQSSASESHAGSATAKSRSVDSRAWTEFAAVSWKQSDTWTQLPLTAL